MICSPKKQDSFSRLGLQDEAPAIWSRHKEKPDCGNEAIATGAAALVAIAVSRMA